MSVTQNKLGYWLLIAIAACVMLGGIFSLGKLAGQWLVEAWVMERPLSWDSGDAASLALVAVALPIPFFIQYCARKLGLITTDTTSKVRRAIFWVVSIAIGILIGIACSITFDSWVSRIAVGLPLSLAVVMMLKLFTREKKTAN